MKSLAALVLIFSFGVASFAHANTISCRTNENGLYYVDGVKQCRYWCHDSCSSVEIIGPGWEGDFGAYHCFGAQVVVQPMPNGQLSPVAVGFKAFEIQTDGVKSYWHAAYYGDLFDLVDRGFQHSNCAN